MLKYTLFPLNQQYFPKYLFLRKLVYSVKKKKVESWYILLRKRDFKFSSMKNLFRLFQTIVRDYLVNLIKYIFSLTIHIMD